MSCVKNVKMYEEYALKTRRDTKKRDVSLVQYKGIKEKERNIKYKGDQNK